MRFMFVYHVSKTAGSAQDIHNYSRVATELGHEVVIYGPERKSSVLRYSLDVESADVVVFILEWWYRLHHGGHLNLVRLIGKSARKRRIVVDCDGLYNDVIQVGGDYNHPHAVASQERIALCDALADTICQPTYHPLRRNVRSFFFHGYSPEWEQPLNFQGKEYGMFYVGNNWFRWRAMSQVLRAIEPIRQQVGRVGIVGYGWDGRVDWLAPPLRDDAYKTDLAYLKKLNVEIMPAVKVNQVIETMSRGILGPVLLRPLFNRLGLVTCRTFETLAANTIPLFDMDEAQAIETYGPSAAELVLNQDATAKIEDVLRRPQDYAPLVADIRRRLAEKHSYAARFQELIDLAKGESLERMDRPACA
jgi:Glycosyl transferases group 1